MLKAADRLLAVMKAADRLRGSILATEILTIWHFRNRRFDRKENTSAIGIVKLILPLQQQRRNNSLCRAVVDVIKLFLEEI